MDQVRCHKPLLSEFFVSDTSRVFESNRLSTVNGAQWALKIEAMFYLTVPFFALAFWRFARFQMLVLVYCLSVAYAGLLTAESCYRCRLYDSPMLEEY